MDIPAAPAALAAWSGVEVLRPLTGGNRNQVMLARRGDEQLVVRRSGRSPAALDWELDLMEHLAAHDVGVPGLVPADDGRRHVDGVLVQELVAGDPPSTDAQWQEVAATLRTLHRVTVGWPQRPGFASARDLLVAERGGDVALDAMPADAVDAVRQSWQPILIGAHCVIHGDIDASNVLVTGARVTVLDWDEARVDVPWFDFAFMPEGADGTVALPVARDVLVTAGIAWEAATCWLPEPDYARRRLAQLYERREGQFT